MVFDDLIAWDIFYIILVSFLLGTPLIPMTIYFGQIIMSSGSTFFIVVICIWSLFSFILARLIVNLKEDINKVSFRKI